MSHLMERRVRGGKIWLVTKWGEVGPFGTPAEADLAEPRLVHDAMVDLSAYVEKIITQASRHGVSIAPFNGKHLVERHSPITAAELAKAVALIEAAGMSVGLRKPRSDRGKPSAAKGNVLSGGNAQLLRQLYTEEANKGLDPNVIATSLATLFGCSFRTVARCLDNLTYYDPGWKSAQIWSEENE